MKRVFYPGKKVKAPCEACGTTGSATYGYGTVNLADGTPVENIMRAICDNCGHVVATAQQSAPIFRAALEARSQSRTHQTSVRIPLVLADFARQTLFEGHAADVERFDLLVKAFAMSLTGTSARRWQAAVENLRTVQDPALDMPCDYQVSLYLNERLRELLERLQREAGLANLSELIRRILVVMDSDSKAEAELHKLILVA